MPKPLTTNKLVQSSLRRALIPVDQSTFTCCDIIDIINEEMSISILPMILRTHEEYFVFDEDTALDSTKTRYKIPYRAIGNKLRDLQYVDNSGAYYEMTRVSIEDRSSYLNGYGTCDYLAYYLQSDEVVLMSSPSSSGNLRFSYYMRPNELVSDSRGSKITNITDQFIEFAINNSICGDNIVVGSVTFSGAATNPTCCENIFIVTCSLTTTATNLKNAINNHSTVDATATSCGSIVEIFSTTNCGFSVTYTDNSPSPCIVPATTSDILRRFTLSQFPEHFSCISKFDFIHGDSPNGLITFDIDKYSDDDLSETITFKQSLLTRIDPITNTEKNLTLNIGDFITQSEETIVPQIPIELHSVIAQRVAIKLLEALGDTQGMQNAQAELNRMEQNIYTLIDNRVEGAPQKIKNKNSLLRSGNSGAILRPRRF